MTASSTLSGLTLNRFLYDIRSPLGANQQDINTNSRRFWQRIYGNALDGEIPAINLADLQKAEQEFSSYVPLLPNHTKNIEPFPSPRNGYYFPVQLGDTFALLMDCSGPTNDTQWEHKSLSDQLTELKAIIYDQDHRPPSVHENLPILGENWLISGQQADPKDDVEAIAQTCYHSLALSKTNQWTQDFRGQGTWHGAIFFELTHPDTTVDGKNCNQHVLIFIFPYDQRKPKLSQPRQQLRTHLIQLCHSRNKILWVHEDRQRLKDKLKYHSGEIQTLVESLTKMDKATLNLNQLQQHLSKAALIAHSYEICLSTLQEHQATLDTNLKNYQSRLKKMEASSPSPSDLALFHTFAEQAKTEYREQLVADYAAMKLGLSPLETYIKTVTNIIELERTKNERTLNQTVAIAGVGISIASLAASFFTEDSAKDVIATIPPRINLVALLPDTSQPVVVNLTLSVAIGLLSAGITAIMIHLWNRH